MCFESSITNAARRRISGSRAGKPSPSAFCVQPDASHSFIGSQPMTWFLCGESLTQPSTSVMRFFAMSSVAGFW